MHYMLVKVIVNFLGALRDHFWSIDSRPIGLKNRITSGFFFKLFMNVDSMV